MNTFKFNKNKTFNIMSKMQTFDIFIIINFLFLFFLFLNFQNLHMKAFNHFRYLPSYFN